MQEEKSSTENRRWEFCSETCLRRGLQQDGRPLVLSKKAGNVPEHCGKLYFSTGGSELSSELYGHCRRDHFQALKRLMENPVPGILPVRELCACTYAVPLLNGKVLFDANTIPDCLRDKQTAVLDTTFQTFRWQEFAGWMKDLASGLLELLFFGYAMEGLYSPLYAALIDMAVAAQPA